MKNFLILYAFISICISFKDVVADDFKSSELLQLQKQIKALQESVQTLSATVKEQQRVIAALQTTKTVTVVDTPKAAPVFVPEIGVVGDITAQLSESKEDEEGNDRLSFRELELVFGHDIDPYSRFDSVITFSDQESPDIEEAYVTYWGLPLGIKGKIGRMREKIGKASALHRDSLDTVDEPLVVQHYLGAEGLFRTGLELTGFTPLSGDTFTQQLTMGVMEGGVGEDGELFGETRRRPSFYSHLSNFLEINDDSNFELGGTYLLGSKDEDSHYEVNAFGIDATYINFITPINKFKLQAEAFFQDRDEAFLVDEDGAVVSLDDHPWGFYGLADYRLQERWGIGGRYDYVESTELDPSSPRDNDRALTGYLTFYQSEFARWRMQYQYARLAKGNEDNRFSLQGTFAIGTHKHQLQ